MALPASPCQGHDHVRRLRRQRARRSSEAFRIHADDRDGDIVQFNRRSKHRRGPGKLALPETVADDDDGIARAGVIERPNPPAELRLDTECLEVVSRNLVDEHALRVGADRAFAAVT